MCGQPLSDSNLKPGAKSKLSKLSPASSSSSPMDLNPKRIDSKSSKVKSSSAIGDGPVLLSSRSQPQPQPPALPSSRTKGLSRSESAPIAKLGSIPIGGNAARPVARTDSAMSLLSDRTPTSTRRAPNPVR